MATTGDPWRILGLAPGASSDEIRRAYRKLAKANHPDAAGEAALPRFLAIQAAYEQLAGPGRSRRPGARPGGTASPPPASPREPWRADPDRARASGRADGRRPGARPTGRPAGGASQNPGEPGGTAGASGAGSGSGAGAGRSGASGRARRPSSRRPSKTATPYSTSYDAADEEPFEPGWSGGTWYGASSGTYWTINPKEYADPRKHGPEYQARARRSRAAGSAEEATPAEPGVDADAGAPEPDRDERGASAAAPGEGSDATFDEAAAAHAARPHRTAWTAADGSRPATGAWSRSPGEPTFTAAPPEGGTPPPPAPVGGDAARFRGPVLPRATTASGRFAIALLGWPPLALFAGAAIGESTGCGRYAASCSELSSPGTWIVAAAILLLLLALPAVATWSAHGSIAALVIGVPSAIVLSAAGGTNLPQASGPLMLGVLAVAYLAGLAYGLIVPRLPEPG
jgi:curved DNA-binding protein CbpA